MTIIDVRGIINRYSFIERMVIEVQQKVENWI